MQLSLLTNQGFDTALDQSPYLDLHKHQIRHKTKELIDEHPIDLDVLVKVVHNTWRCINNIQFGNRPYALGRDVILSPQVVGNLFHDLIPLELARFYKEQWRKGQGKKEKDLVCLNNKHFSVEIKTSSSRKYIYGNRSYAQKTNSSGKDKNGYYLAINFQKFTRKIKQPGIYLIRFGWLDHDDWIPQAASSGQQARLNSAVAKAKLLNIYQNPAL